MSANSALAERFELMGRLIEVLGEDPKLHCEPDTATLRQGN